VNIKHSFDYSLQLEHFLQQNNVWFKIHDKKTTVHTADAAAATGIPLNRITKSLVCLAGSGGIVAIIPGDNKLDVRKLSQLVNKNVRVCPFNQSHDYSGYDPGATPPVHYKNVEKVFFDKKLLEYDTVFGGGGSRKKLIEMKPKDIVRLNNATVAEIGVEEK